MIKSRRLRWVGHLTRIEEGRSAADYRPSGRPRRSWENNIRIDLKKIDDKKYVKKKEREQHLPGYYP